MKKLVVGSLQYYPKFGKFKENISKVSKLIKTINKQLDILILPEMAFSGYMFDNKKEIEDHVELKNGKTFQWTSDMAKKLNCMVCTILILTFI